MMLSVSDLYRYSIGSTHFKLRVRGCLVKHNRSNKVEKSGHIFENLKRIVVFLTTIFRNMDDFTGFAADLFLIRKPLGLVFLCFIAFEATAVEFIGRSACMNCHSEQNAQWLGSHHDLAMQVANNNTVLGDFDNATVSIFGVTSSFFKKDGKFMVRTDGPDGKLQDYEIKYAFGVDPLQQYLIEFPGGRMQALSLAWDSRQKERGGQRWFHLYPGEKIAHDDELHWTKPSQNWNNMCAECHSTHLEKRYDPATRTFSTIWSEIDVSCEACHGPGSEHVVWAEHKSGQDKLAGSKGLIIQLDERKDVQWTNNPKTGKAVRSKIRNSDKEIDMCARCHSRRSPITSNYVHGEPLLDHYLPRLLDQGMYFADGQINDEVYVYGSFVQSKMYHAGISCSDCHQPHSLKLKIPGNGVCLQCHQSSKYDQNKHHFHKMGTLGASCAECHMPAKTYMVVDPRHDHSMRIPRPDLSVQIGTPNACNNCHQDKNPEWAARQVDLWYGHKPKGFQSYAVALSAARQGLPGTGDKLAALIRDTETPDIARATALTQISSYLSSATADVFAVGLTDSSPVVRVAALNVIESMSAEIRVRFAFPMLSDPIRAVRIEAARGLASLPVGELKAEQQLLLEKGLKEYIDAQLAMAERAESQTNLGILYANQNKFGKAISAYKLAAELNPAYIPAYVNLADLYRSQGEESKAVDVLRHGLTIASDSAILHHVLGLTLVRQKLINEAVEELRMASKLNTNDVRYVYVYAVALNSTGKPKQAVAVLEKAENVFPNNVEILNALLAFYRDMGDQEKARMYAKKLGAIRN